MIKIPDRIEELLLLPEFELPLCFLNSHLFLSPALREESEMPCERGRMIHDIMYEVIAKTEYYGQMDPIDEKNYKKTKNELYSKHADNPLYTSYIRRLNNYYKIVQKNELNPVRHADLMYDLTQRASAIGILNKSRDKSNLVPILLYYGLMTMNLVDMDTSNPSMIEDNYRIIDACRFQFLLLDDDEIKKDDEKTIEGKKKILEHLKWKLTKNILEYARLLKELSPNISQTEITGDFIFDILGDIVPAEKDSKGGMSEVKIKKHREKTPVRLSIDDLLNAPYYTAVMSKIEDKVILENKDFYEAKNLYKHLNRGRMSSIDILRLKSLGILDDKDVKSLFEQFTKNNKNSSKNDNEFDLNIMWLYLGGFGREERKEELNLEYIVYRWCLEKKSISKEKVIHAIRKGWVDAISIMRLVNDGLLPRNEVNEALESSENNAFKKLSYSEYEELLGRENFDGQSFLAAIRYGWIDKKIVIELLANNLIPYDDTIEALEHSPRRNYNEIHEYDIETQIITWCATFQSSLKWISIGDLENKIREIKKDDEESKVYTPSDDLIEKIVELIYGDYNQLSALLTSTAFDYHSMDKVIDKSNEKGYLSQEATERLRKVVKKFRIDQLENHQNAVRYDERDYPDDDGGGKGEEPPENQAIRLIYDPVKRLKIFAAINTNTKNPSIGDLKRIIIDGMHENRNGKPTKSSFHGYELIVLPEADVAILEKLYEVERIEEKSQDGNISHRMQYTRDKQGHLIPMKDNNRTYILPLDEALELAQNFNKEQLFKSNKCIRCNHSLNWLENVGESVKAMMKRDGKSNENTRNAEERIDNTVEKYLEEMRRNYTQLKRSQTRE